MSVPRVVVVAAVIERDRHFLLTLRPQGTHLAGRWESPGGKVDTAEHHADALRRELSEELAIVATVGACVHVATHAYPDRIVEIHFYRCTFDGIATPVFGQAMRWVARRDLVGLPFPEADAELIRLLTAAE